MSFERILFRATGGNVYLKQAVVGHPVIDPVSGEKGTRIDNAPLNGNDFRSNNDEDEDKDVDRYSFH
ncbi:hypothetical protein AgCh_000964 [Apium graveolens]